MGWCWTNRTVCLFVFSYEKSDWLYYKRESKKPRRFHAYGAKAWLTEP